VEHLAVVYHDVAEVWKIGNSRYLTASERKAARIEKDR
jgi:hypothetical protein